MSLFEDLVEELKENNLLEETADGPRREKSEPAGKTVTGQDSPPPESHAPDPASLEMPGSLDFLERNRETAADEGSHPEPLFKSSGPVPELFEPAPAGPVSEASAGPVSEAPTGPESFVETRPETQPAGEAAPAPEPAPAPTVARAQEAASDPEPAPPAPVAAVEPEPVPVAVPVTNDPPPRVNPAELAAERKRAEEKEFFRRRALDEVNGLQMVEHVLAGVEREQMKTVPKTYDDMQVKHALHEFLQIEEDSRSPQHAQAEFRLMQETEDWYSALSRRDRNISVAHLRRYCETTKPSLSSQALIALARFYRNSPYSESVRSKFDLVVTRLFTKERGGDKRELVFQSDELIRHIQELYAEWASVPLYAAEEDESAVLISALKFQDFINEARQAETFDELVKKDFFKRLKVFKEETSDNFFSPVLLAAAIESNVVVGNRYVELIDQERNSSDVSELTNKYGIVHDRSISEATSKTMDLLEILRERKPEPAAAEESSAAETEAAADEEKKETDGGAYGTLFRANKKLVIATALTVVLAGVYFLLGGFSFFSGGAALVSGEAQTVNLERSSLRDYVRSARIKDGTLYAITAEKWNGASRAEKEEVVDKFLKAGQAKGFEKVYLLNGDGRPVVSATRDEVRILE